LDKKLHEQKLAALTDEQRIVALNKDVTDLKKQQTKYNKEDNEFKSIQIEINDKNKSIEEARLNIAKETAKAEKEITQQKQVQAGIAGIRGGNQFNDASEDALKEIARRNRNQAQAIQGGSGGYGLGQNLEVARLLAEAQNAEKELSFRRNFRQTVGALGESGARARFAGDPLQFDRVLQQLTGTQDKSTILLQSLDDRLQTAGFGRR